jgi:hypothetical protein
MLNFVRDFWVHIPSEYTTVLFYPARLIPNFTKLPNGCTLEIQSCKNPDNFSRNSVGKFNCIWPEIVPKITFNNLKPYETCKSFLILIGFETLLGKP